MLIAVQFKTDGNVKDWIYLEVRDIAQLYRHFSINAVSVLQWIAINHRPLLFMHLLLLFIERTVHLSSAVNSNISISPASRLDGHIWLDDRYHHIKQ